MAPEDRLGAAAIFQLEGALVSEFISKAPWLKQWVTDMCDLQENSFLTYLVKSESTVADKY